MSDDIYCFHGEALIKLCRICGYLIGDRRKDVVLVLNKLENAFNKVNFKNDVVGIHPKSICRKCYLTLWNVKEKGQIPSQVVAKWKPHSNDNCETCALSVTKSKGGRPKKKVSPGRPSKVLSVTDIMKLDSSKHVPPEVEKAMAHVMNIKMQQSCNKSVQLQSTCGPPVTVQALTAARKDSASVCERTIRSRSKECKDVVSIISGTSDGSLTRQTTHMIRSMDVKERETIIASLGVSTVSVVPADNVAAMKGTLNISWNKLRDISRWLATFNVKFASEKKARIAAADMRGEGLVAEMAPLIVSKGKGKPMVIEPTPWCYLYNLVGHILNRLNQLKQLKQINMYHLNEIQVKIGGDHGSDTFKQCYEICNVNNPNKKENTVVFCIFQEKDSRANLRICLERFRAHINQLMKITWEGYSFRVFMFGDYQYLGYMYGLSGSSARHSCLWCLVTTDEIQLPPHDRCHVIKRTLDSIKEDYHRFVTDGKDLRRAKFFNNVIDESFFDIELSQICLPGLHLTLGIVLKIYNLLENYALSCDIEIAIFKSNDEIDNGLFGELVHQLYILKTEVQQLESSYTALQDERNWILISSNEADHHNIVPQYDVMLQEIEDSINKNTAEIDKLIRKSKVDLDGPCNRGLDDTLKLMGVERQAYYGKCLVGNACHTILKDGNIKMLCKSIPNIVLAETGNELFHAKAIHQCDKFHALLSKYGACDQIFNSANYLDEDIINILIENVKEFMVYFRTNWQNERITPKMHILEDHVVEFVRNWKMGCGFYGEQGVEAIHQEFNKMSRPYSNIKNKLDCLKYKMDMHMLATAPKAVGLKVEKKRRNLKRKTTFNLEK